MDDEIKGRLIFIGSFLVTMILLIQLVVIFQQ